MKKQNIGEAREILNEIETVEDEIKRLESKRALFLKKYVSVCSRGIFETREMDLSAEDVLALIDLRKKKIRELEKKLEEL